MSDDDAPRRALALSLASDPFYRAITVECTSAEAQLQVLEEYFGYALREAHRTGRRVLAPIASQGAAAWLLPRSAEVAREEAREKHRFLASLLGPRGSAAYDAIVEFMSGIAPRHVPEGAWYLSIVGVHPEAQGRGLGEALLAPTLREASQLGRTCYLETFTPRNLGFYRRLGFAAVAEVPEPTTGSPYVIMRREPPPAR